MIVYKELKVMKKKLSTFINVGETGKEGITEGSIETNKVSFRVLWLKNMLIRMFKVEIYLS